MNSVTLVGIGRVGRALRATISAAGYHVDALVVKDAFEWRNANVNDPLIDHVTGIEELGLIDSSVVIISTQDSEIPNVVLRLRGLIRPGCLVFHTSGSISSEILTPLKHAGAHIGSIHPLVSVAGGRADEKQFRDVFFCVEGDPEACSFADTMVSDLGGEVFSIRPEHKSLYHAAAVVACGHLTALVESSLVMMEHAGVARTTARKILMPLIQSTVENIDRMSTSNALTGPFARGDVETIERHLASLKAVDDRHLSEIYSLLGEYSLSLALEKGVDSGRVEAIREKINIARSSFK